MLLPTASLSFSLPPTMYPYPHLLHLYSFIERILAAPTSTQAKSNQRSLISWILWIIILNSLLDLLKLIRKITFNHKRCIDIFCVMLTIIRAGKWETTHLDRSSELSFSSLITFYPEALGWVPHGERCGKTRANNHFLPLSAHHWERKTLFPHVLY